MEADVDAIEDNLTLLGKEHGVNGTFANFVSESGALEFFTFATTGSPKKISRLLADITGYAPLPPIFSLGFHFSKWDATSAQIVMERNELFSTYQFQVDVLWQDIDHTTDKKYFAFDELRYPPQEVESLNLAVEADKRRLVVITDPHIKVHEDYPVYFNGTFYEKESYGDPWSIGPISKGKR